MQQYTLSVLYVLYTPYTHLILHRRYCFPFPTHAVYVTDEDLHVQTAQPVIHPVVAMLNNQSEEKAWQPWNRSASRSRTLASSPGKLFAFTTLLSEDLLLWIPAHYQPA